MSGGWRFSPGSEEAISSLTTRLLSSPREQRNKWLDNFKEQHKDNPYKMSIYNLLRVSAMNRDKIEDERVNTQKDPIDAFYESIESEPIARFDYMLEEGSRNTALFKILAERLSGQAVERICKHLFETKDLTVLYVDNLFRFFFPVFLKRGYSWFSLDIMVKGNKVYPLAFRSLMQILLRDQDISNTMINDFVLTLDETGKYEFLAVVMELDLSNEELIHNLISITSAYKGVEKSERVQNYVFNTLIQLSTHCISDWNYGRLLLAYLQAVSLGQANFDIRTVERLIEMHRSPFKRPCLSVLGEAIKALSEAAIPPDPS